MDRSGACLLAGGEDTSYSRGVKTGEIIIDESADAALSAEDAAAFERSLPKQAESLPNEQSYGGLRPLGLLQARGGKGDKLQLIKGIGAQNEERLHRLGIWHFDQIANWTPANVKWVASYLSFPGRIERENWIVQAQKFAREAQLKRR